MDASTLKPAVLEGVDLVFVRELTGGIYFGEKKRDATERVGSVHLHGGGDRAHRARRRAARAHAARASSPRSTSRTCSRPRGCGAR